MGYKVGSDINIYMFILQTVSYFVFLFIFQHLQVNKSNNNIILAEVNFILIKSVNSYYLLVIFIHCNL